MSQDSVPSRRSEAHMQVRVPTLRSIKMRDKDKASVSSRSKDSSSKSSKDGGSSHRSFTNRWRKTSRDERSSYKSSDYWAKPPVQYENTYKMDPPTAKFMPGAVQEKMRKIFAEHLDDVQYDGQLMGFKTKVVSDAIKDSVKKLELPRFKLVTWVMICEKAGNDIRAASRGLWDNECDSYATVTYENQTLYALANVYAIYQE